MEELQNEDAKNNRTLEQFEEDCRKQDELIFSAVVGLTLYHRMKEIPTGEKAK